MSKRNKTQQLLQDIRDKIACGVYSPNARIPSVRQMAKQATVSNYTVVQAYEQLVASKELEAIKGVGYFVPVNDRTAHEDCATKTAVSTLVGQHVLDTSWLMGHLFHNQPTHRSSGSGLFDDDWMPDPEVIGRCSRHAIRQIGHFVFGYGHLQGYLGLRQHLAHQLTDDNIPASADQMVTTTGVSHAMELLLRSLCAAGDTILVDDPCWYWVIGCAQQMGIQVIGVPRCAAGIDLIEFERCLNQHRPKLYITNSCLHNPTGYNYSAQHLHQVLSLLQRYALSAKARSSAPCYLVEDDVFAHLAKDNHPLKFATLDGFQQVIYVNGVAKSLGGNWRVGVIVCPDTLLERVLRQKMLSNVACSELNERIIEQLWKDSSYPRHIRKMQQKMHCAHQQLIEWLVALQFMDRSTQFEQASLFVWLDIGVDSATLALTAKASEWHIAPGHLFSANGNFTTHIRLNVGTTSRAFLVWLRDYVDTCLLLANDTV